MPATKVDFKRELRELYAPRREPSLVEVPELAFLMVDGHGDPNTAAAYRDAIETLYAVAYTAKFTVRQAPNGVDFGVMPLEGLWWAPQMSKFTTEDKSAWSWTAMIMQPAPVTAEIVEAARDKVAAKKALPALELLRFEPWREGLAAQLMHLGPYADEGPTIKRLHAFIAEQGYEPTGKHHEIYLSDPNRSAPEKLRTVIRQPVASRNRFGAEPVVGRDHSGWKSAIVLPSGSLNQAERPIPGDVTTWLIVLNASMSYCSNSIPLSTSSATSVSMSVDQKRTCV
jgi:hypothetical protein